MSTHPTAWGLAVAIFCCCAADGRGEEKAGTSWAALSPADALALNSQAVSERPPDAEASGRFSADHAAHAGAYNLQAPGITVVSRPGGHIRLWVSWYQQNNQPGGGAIGNGATPHTVYAYSDDPFGAAEPSGPLY